MIIETTGPSILKRPSTAFAEEKPVSIECLLDGLGQQAPAPTTEVKPREIKPPQYNEPSNDESFARDESIPITERVLKEPVSFSNMEPQQPLQQVIQADPDDIDDDIE